MEKWLNEKRNTPPPSSASEMKFLAAFLASTYRSWSESNSLTILTLFDYYIFLGFASLLAPTGPLYVMMRYYTLSARSARPCRSAPTYLGGAKRYFYRTQVYLGSDLWVPVSKTNSVMFG